jgi:ACT domain-containing protein
VVLEKQLKDNGIDLTANQLASLKESVEGMTSGNISPSDIQGTVSRIVTLRDQQLKLVLEKPEKKIENKVEDMDLALSPPRLTPG